jgi:hypothetical protein
LEGESCWKSGGGRTRLYTWPRVGLADEARSDAIPDATGGEGGHRAAKPHAVIHRYVSNRSNLRKNTIQKRERYIQDNVSSTIEIFAKTSEESTCSLLTKFPEC